MEIKNIYFGQDTNNLKRGLVKAVTTVASNITPHLAVVAARQILINPFGRREVRLNHVDVTHELDIQTRLGKVHLYYFRGGPKHVLVCHGWADTTQSMQTIIKSLLDDGYTVWSIDHIGHGKSEGKVSHIFGYLDGLRNAINLIETTYGPLHAIVGHSAGACAILNLETEILADKRTVLMGLPVQFFEGMFTRMKRLGIHRKILLDLLESVSKQYHGDWRDLKPTNHKWKLNESTLFVHDKEDVFSPFLDIMLLTNGTPARVLTTENLGHRKILKDNKVMAKILEHIGE